MQTNKEKFPPVLPKAKSENDSFATHKFAFTIAEPALLNAKIELLEQQLEDANLIIERLIKMGNVGRLQAANAVIIKCFESGSPSAADFIKKWGR